MNKYIPAITLSLTVAALTAINIWLITATDLDRRILIPALVLELLLLLGIVWGGHALLRRRLFRPLNMLKEQFKVLTHIDSSHRFSLPDSHYLGDLPKYAQELGHALVRERNDTARAMDAAATRVDQRKARLEAILHDLTEGVVVCTLEHDIVLFNQAAAALLQDAGTLGLHRSISPFFCDPVLTRELSNILELYHTEQLQQIAEFETGLSKGGRVHIRMNLIVEADGVLNGYVLSLDGRGLLRLPDDGDTVSVLSDRPEFYDFSLFDHAPAADLMQRPLDGLNFVVFDTETTGLQPSKGDEIVQIAGVRVSGERISDHDWFDRLVKPGFPIPRQSIRFHGITDDMVKTAAPASDVLSDFHRFCQGAVLVAHNAAFDMKFLKLKEAQCGVSFEQPVLDTLLMSFVLHPSHSAHTLDAIATRFGVDIPREARHTALGDARATAQIFIRMLRTLPHQDIVTLGDAIHASNQVFEIRRLQEQF